jgi:hypothetical protein
MAKARLYAFNGTEPKAEVRGQAKVILDVLRANTEPRLAADINADVEATGLLKTRQDTLRVTLYYILVFKKRGMVAASEPALEPVAEEIGDDAPPDDFEDDFEGATELAETE